MKESFDDLETTMARAIEKFGLIGVPVGRPIETINAQVSRA